MKNSMFTLFYLIAAALLISGCASISGFEEGRSLGKGTSELMVSGNYVSLPGILNVDDDEVDVGLNSLGFPNIDASYKYGVTDKLDVGGRITTNLNLGVFMKYQLIGDDMSKFALGTGLEFATSLGILYNIQIPVNMSYYITDAVSINLSPKYVYQFPAESFSTSINYLGGNAGILFGKKNKFGIDVGYYNVDQSSSLFTFGIGGKFRFNAN